MNPVKPVVIVSRCLGIEACRYNGEIIRDDLTSALANFADIISVCPESDIGMGTPRDPVRIVENKDGKFLHQEKTGNNYTEAMANFSESFLQSRIIADGFILKSKSPSCAIHDARIYNGFSPTAMHHRGAGFLGEAVLIHHPLSPVEDEARLSNFSIRENFLTRLFIFAMLRRLSDAGIHELLEFHRRNKILLMAYGHSGQKQLGHILGDYTENYNAVYTAYAETFRKHLSTIPTYKNRINALVHAIGGMKKELKSTEKKLFADSLEDYRKERLPYPAILKLLHGWAVTYENNYLLEQSILNPFPADLFLLNDSGTGRKSAR